MSGKRVRTISIIFLVILSQQLFAQRIDSAKSIKGAFDAIQTINQILEVLDKPKDSTLVYNEYTIGTIDSICNSKKDSWDFADEDSPLNGANNLVLGNSLKYKSHLIGSFEVINVTYNHWFLLEIKFKYSFNYGGKRQIDTSICQVLQSDCKLLLSFKKGDYGVESFEGEVILTRGLEEFKKKYPLINFNISSENIPIRTNRSVIFINDPANQLIYGFACSIGGMPPRGYEIFARLFYFKHFDIIEKLLFSPNPVTRLYACDALEHAYKKNLYVLPLKISDRINEIKNEETKIECCWGCSYEIIPIKEAVIKAEGAQKHLYDTFIFFKDEE